MDEFDFEAGWDSGVKTSKTSKVSDEDYDIDAIIAEAAEAHSVDPDLVRAIIEVESGGKPKAKSSKGATGLMQLMPDTAKAMGVKNIEDPKQNIMGGARYISEQLAETGGDIPLALARYNAGPTAVKKHGGIPPFKETQDYVHKVQAQYKKLSGTEFDDRRFAPADIDVPFDFEAYDPSEKDVVEGFDFEGDSEITPIVKAPVPDLGIDLAPADMAPEGSNVPEALGGLLEIPAVEDKLGAIMEPVNKQLAKGVDVLDATKQTIFDKVSPDKSLAEVGGKPPAEMTDVDRAKLALDIMNQTIEGMRVAEETKPEREIIKALEDQPQFMGEAVGEPEFLGKAIDVPFMAGRFVSGLPGQVTEADLAEGIEKKEPSPAELGGELMGTAAEYFHNLPGPKKVYYKTGEMKPGEIGREVGKIMTQFGFEIAGANMIFKALGAGIDTVVNSELWKSLGKKFGKLEQRIGLQTAADLANEMKAAGASDAEILQALRKFSGKDREKVFKEYFEKARKETQKASEAETKAFYKKEAERAKEAVMKGKGKQKLIEGPKPPETKPVPVEKKPEFGAKPPEVKTELGKEVKAQLEEKKKPGPLAQLKAKEAELKQPPTEVPKVEPKAKELPPPKPKELMAPDERKTIGKAVAKKYGVDYRGYWPDMKKEVFNMEVGEGKVETFYADNLEDSTVKKAVEATKKKWGISDRRLVTELPKVERRVGERRDLALRKAVDQMSDAEKEFVIPELRRMNKERLKQISGMKKEIITDPLTGLRNRQGLDKVIGRAEKKGKETQYTFIDLVGFKGINDRIGYSAGDQALEHIGKAMKSLKLKGSRTGGDEFGFVSNTPEQAEENVKKLQAYFKENPVRVTDKAGKEFDIEVMFRHGTAKVDYAAKDIPGKTKAAQDIAEAKKATEPKEFKRGEAHPGIKEVEKPVRKRTEITYRDYRDTKDLTAKTYVEYKGLKIAKQHKSLYNIIDESNKTVGQYAGLQGAIDAIDTGNYTAKIVPKAKEAPKPGENIRTLRGFVKFIGKINPLNFKGEVKLLPKTAQFLFKSTGVPIDDAVRQLVDDGWLDKDTTVATFLETLRTDTNILSRDRLARDISEKKEHEKTAEEKRIEKEMKWQPEEPPEGEYITMDAMDLPEGKKLTLIEGKTATGWDVYEVQETEPFGPITLKDGQEITLNPGDKVQVLKSDLEKPEKPKEKLEVIDKKGTYVNWNETKIREKDGVKATYYALRYKDKSFRGWKTKAEIERMKSAAEKGKEAMTLDQGTYGKQRPEGMKKAAKAKQQGLGLKGTQTETEGLFKGYTGTVLYSGIPIHELAKTSKVLGRLYEKHVGTPIWNFLADTLPKEAGKRAKIINAINKGIILDYNKDPDFIKFRDDTILKIELARKRAKELADIIHKLPRAEQVRYSQIIQGSITQLPERYKEAEEIINKFQILEKELQRLGILGPDNIFKQLTRKELATKFKEIKALDDKIKMFRKRLQPIIKKGRVIRKSSELTFEEVKNTITKTDTGTYKTNMSKWTKLNEERIKEALMSRGFAEGEATQMIERVKESVVETGAKTGTYKEMTTILEKVVTKTITNEIERIKTFSRSYMARAKASILKDIKDAIAERNKIVQRVQTHYKMSGKNYLRRAYKSIETEENFLSSLMGYATKRPRLKKGYNVKRKDLDYLYRTHLGEIKEAPYLVYKGLSEEFHDMYMMELFNRISENKKWAVSPEEWYNIMHVRSRAEKVAHYKDFKPLPMTDKLGKLSGAMVDQYIWDDLNEAVKAHGEIMKAYDKLLNLWKIGKVPFNPATQIRNILSNTILADFAGLSPFRLDIYIRAAIDLLRQSGYWEEANSQTALFGKEWIGGEVEEFLKDVSEFREDGGSFPAQAAKSIKYLLNKPLQVYQGIEQFFKLAVYIHQREAGASIEDAAKHAEEFIFNYQKVPPAIRWAKRWYSPFITFSYKAVPKFAETAVKRPWKIVKYALLMAGVEEIARRSFGESKEEVEREKRALPDYMKKSILPGQLSHLRIFYKDQYNRSKYLDLSFILPWGDVAEQWGQSHLVGRPFLPSHPLWITIGEVAFNEVLFTGQELTVKDIDTGSEYMKKLATQIWRQAAPSLAGSYSFNKLMAAIHGEKDWAMRDRSVGEAVFDVFLGLKVRSIDYNEEVAKRTREYKSRIKEIRRRFSEDYEKIFIRNPTPDLERDNERWLKLMKKQDEQIQKIMDKLTEISK